MSIFSNKVAAELKQIGVEFGSAFTFKAWLNETSDLATVTVSFFADQNTRKTTILALENAGVTTYEIQNVDWSSARANGLDLKLTDLAYHFHIKLHVPLYDEQD